MPKAHEIATELRKMADALDSHPEAEIAGPHLYFSTFLMPNDKAKQVFLNLAKVLPRPYKKEHESEELRISGDIGSTSFAVTIRRSDMCKLIKPAQPAEYECNPILSALEEAQLEGTNG